MTRSYRILATLALACGLTACGGKKQAAAKSSAPPVVPQQLKENQLAGTPSTFLSNHAGSPVHWQTWRPSLLDDAKKSQRLIVALVGSARFPGSAETMKVINSSPALVERLNKNFIPVLVDGEISRDTMLMSAALASELGEPVAFPFLVVLSPDGAPVTWKVMSYLSDAAVIDRFEQALGVIERLWRESPDYVTNDSLAKLNHRRENPPEPEPEVKDPDQRLATLAESMRELCSLWDDTSDTFDNLGGLFPSEALSLLARASHAQALPEPLRAKCRKVADGLATSVLRSAMIDPLDGGVYPARIGISWNFPVPTRDSITQAEAIAGFIDLHHFLGYPGAVGLAERAAHFSEDNFLNDDGLFSVTRAMTAMQPTHALWTIGDLSLGLSSEEFAVWKVASEIKTLGNLPPEADPSRRTFRMNALHMALSPEEVAAKVGRPVDEVKQLLDSGRQKILRARETLHPEPEKDDTPSATASFMMISAYCHLYTATGDGEWKQKAVKLGQKCREAFGQARFLNERPGANPDPMSDSRAFTYAIAARASLDLGAVTLDDQWNRWASDLMTLLGENFANPEGDRLSESREGFAIIPYPFEDRAMIFGPSTHGIVRQNLQSLSKLDEPVPPGLIRWLTSLPDLGRSPIIYMDSVSALVSEFDAASLWVGAQVSPDAREAATRLPLRTFERKSGGSDPQAIKFIAPGGQESILPSAADVKALVGQ
ncbi:DUF255 domain-containing protein [Haloferula sargassicola]|uniref:Spermatogenesis-associated protein 20-like TRX domain-containing protein n=1 Tax=Haloferula sargassicola TaxID=490096 RepID=A0ABP9UPW0_9BACT